MHNPTLLSLHLGDVFSDFTPVDTYLHAFGVERVSCNLCLPEQFREVMSLIEKNGVDAIETRHMRYWQEQWHVIKPLFLEISSVAKHTHVPMINSPDIFRWTGDKYAYLSYLSGRNIPVPPMVRLDSEKPFDIVSYLSQKPNGVVLKPSRGAKAYGLVFIRHANRGNRRRFRLDVPTEVERGKGRIESDLYSPSELMDYVRTYLHHHLRNQTSIMVQDVVPVRFETSCIVMRALKPYVIRRWNGMRTGIAHESYGGRNEYLSRPPTKLLRFVRRVFEALPRAIQRQTILRFDVFGGEKDYLLLEIEAASLRLFSDPGEADANRAYATVLATIVKQAHQLFLKYGSRARGVTRYTSPNYRLIGPFIVPD